MKMPQPGDPMPTFGWCYTEAGPPAHPPSKCRWCNSLMHVLQHSPNRVIYCPTCDRTNQMTTNQEGNTA